METNSVQKTKSIAINIPQRYTVDSPNSPNSSNSPATTPNSHMSVSPNYKSPSERTKMTWNKLGSLSPDVPKNNTFLTNFPRLGSVEHKKNSPDILITPSPKNKSKLYSNKDNFRPYDAMARSKGSGIIPYALSDGKVYFLFQHAVNPLRKKDYGWNDFGGKNNPNENTINAAAREFSEETSCLFFLKEDNDLVHELIDSVLLPRSIPKNEINKLYDLLKENKALMYDDDTIYLLKSLIPISQKFFAKRINEAESGPIFISSKETYISYFMRVAYIPADEIPRAEDIHIPYEERYIRMCKWFTFDELLGLDERDFHKRLQITKIKQRVKNYYNKKLFV
jgi:hypothetical protein